MTTIAKIRIANILLDVENPRLGKPDVGTRWTQSTILEHFAENKKVQNLAEDIATKGLNPSKRPIVMPASGQRNIFVALEGNRRLAVTKMLENPRLSGSGAVGKKFHALSKRSVQLSDEIECVVVTSREEADHWVRMEHGLGKDGTSTLEWGPSEKSRYQERVHGEGRYSKSTALVDTLADAGMIDSATVRKTPITTLDRLLNDPDVRTSLDLDFQDISIGDSNRDAILRVVSDLATGAIKVDKVKTKEQRRKYIAKVLADPGSRASTSKAQSTSSTKSAQRSKPQKPHHLRKHLIPSDFRPTIKQKRLAEIYDELRRLSVEDYTNAVSVLFRSFVEIAVWDYYQRRGWSLSGGLAAAVKKSTKTLASEGHIPQGVENVVIRAADDDDSFISVKALHQFVHGPYDHPTPKQLNRIWSSLQPYLAALLSN